MTGVSTRKPPLISVVSCIYNPLPVCQQTIESLLERTTFPITDWEYVMVYNHPPYPDVLPYIQSVQKKYPNVRIVDKGKNLGCSAGYSEGFKHSDAKYLVKLDDDAIVLEPDWAQKFLKGFSKIPNLAYLSSDMDARQTHPYREIDFGDGVVLQAEMPLVGFGGLVFFDSAFLKEINYFMGESSHVVYGADGKVDSVIQHKAQERYYGGEEVYCAQQSHLKRKIFGYYPPVRSGHQGCEQRIDLFYPWKFWHGFAGKFDGDLFQFQQDPQAIHACFLEVIKQPNDWYKIIIFKLLPEHPEWTWRFEFYKQALQIFYSTENGLVKKYAGEFIEYCKGKV